MRERAKRVDGPVSGNEWSHAVESTLPFRKKGLANVCLVSGFEDDDCQRPAAVTWTFRHTNGQTHLQKKLRIKDYAQEKGREGGEVVWHKIDEQGSGLSRSEVTPKCQAGFVWPGAVQLAQRRCKSILVSFRRHRPRRAFGWPWEQPTSTENKARGGTGILSSARRVGKGSWRITIKVCITINNTHPRATNSTHSTYLNRTYPARMVCLISIIKISFSYRFVTLKI